MRPIAIVGLFAIASVRVALASCPELAERQAYLDTQRENLRACEGMTCGQLANKKCTCANEHTMVNLAEKAVAACRAQSSSGARGSGGGAGRGTSGGVDPADIEALGAAVGNLIGNALDESDDEDRRRADQADREAIQRQLDSANARAERLERELADVKKKAALDALKALLRASYAAAWAPPPPRPASTATDIATMCGFEPTKPGTTGAMPADLTTCRRLLCPTPISPVEERGWCPDPVDVYVKHGLYAHYPLPAKAKNAVSTWELAQDTIAFCISVTDWEEHKSKHGAPPQQCPNP